MYDKVAQSDPQKVMRASDKAFYKPVPEAQQIKSQYQKEAGLPVDSPPRIKKIDVEKSKRIADAFDKMKHNPADPKVKTAYDALGRETVAQYQKLLDSGVEFDYWRGRGEPYKNSREMAGDIQNNKKLKVLATEGNFGQEAITPQELADNPLLRRTKFKDANGQPLLVNDIFRAVHDYFGHGTSGTGFGAIGEEGAWAAHMKMFSPEARKALTTETRGQNSWVNFGRQLRRPDGSLPQKGDIDYISPTERPFGEQKVGLLPEEFTMDEYYTMWKNPEFRKRAKQGGFTAATAYLLANPEEAEASLGSSILKAAIKSNDMFEGYKILKPTPENFDTRIDPRKLEQDKLRDLEIGTSQSRLQDVPEVGLEDFEGKRFVMGMADRTAAGDNIYEIKGQKLVNPITGEPDPVIRQGGQDYMLDPANIKEGRLWASDLSPSRQQQAVGNMDFVETGDESLFLPFRMAQSATDHAVSTSELMLKYARQNMKKKDIRAFDKMMREGVVVDGKRVIIPDFKGLADPDSIADLSAMNSAQRKALIHVLDRDFRDAGSLSKGEARVAVTDPKQLDAPDYGFQNVGQLEGGTETRSSKIEVPEGGHRTYRAGVKGKPVGKLNTDATAFDLVPEAVKARGIDPNNIKAQDAYTLRQSSIYGDEDMPSMKRGVITEDLLRSLEERGKLGKSVPPETLKKAADHLNQNMQQGSIDWDLLKGLGLGAGTMAAVYGIAQSPEVQASLMEAMPEQQNEQQQIAPKPEKPVLPDREQVLREQQQKGIDLFYTGDSKTIEQYQEAYDNGEADPAQYKYIMESAEQATDKIMKDAEEQSVIPDEVVSEEVITEEANRGMPQSDVRESLQKPDIAISPEGKLLPDQSKAVKPVTEEEVTAGSQAQKLAETVVGMGEAGLTVLTAMASESTAGLGGIGVGVMHKLADTLESMGRSDLAQAARPDASASETIEGLQAASGDAIYQPKTEKGQQYIENLGEGIENLGQFMKERGGEEVMQAQDEGAEWAYKWGSENVSPEFGAAYGTLVGKFHELI